MRLLRSPILHVSVSDVSFTAAAWHVLPRFYPRTISAIWNAVKIECNLYKTSGTRQFVWLPINGSFFLGLTLHTLEAEFWLHYRRSRVTMPHIWFSGTVAKHKDALKRSYAMTACLLVSWISSSNLALLLAALGIISRQITKWARVIPVLAITHRHPSARPLSYNCTLLLILAKKLKKKSCDLTNRSEVAKKNTKIENPRLGLVAQSKKHFDQ